MQIWRGPYLPFPHAAPLDGHTWPQEGRKGLSQQVTKHVCFMKNYIDWIYRESSVVFIEDPGSVRDFFTAISGALRRCTGSELVSSPVAVTVQLLKPWLLGLHWALHILSPLAMTYGLASSTEANTHIYLHSSVLSSSNTFRSYLLVEIKGGYFLCIVCIILVVAKVIFIHGECMNLFQIRLPVKAGC